MSRPSLITNIQLLRAIAAGMVIVCHVAAGWSNYLVGLGLAGVDVFFVISGFVMAKVGDHASMEDHHARAVRNFVVDRIARIYPLYWIVLAFVAVVSGKYPALIQPGPEYSVWRLITLTAPTNNYLVVAWTLCVEMYFYALISAVLLISGKLFKPTLTVFATLAAIAILRSDLRGWSFFSQPIILEFIFGVFIYLFIGKVSISKTAALLLLAIGVVGIAWGATYFAPGAGPHDTVAIRPFVFGIPAATIVFASIALEKYYRAPRFAVVLGDGSYSAYLWHFPLLALLVITRRKGWFLSEFPNGPEWLLKTLSAMILLAAFLGVGVLSYRFIEKPIKKFIRGLRPEKSRACKAVPEQCGETTPLLS